MDVRIKILHPLAVVPTYSKFGDAGADLYAVEHTYLGRQPSIVQFGIALEIPHGYEAQIRPRSSISRRGIHVAMGTIDSGYRGEISATCWVVEGVLGREMPDEDFVLVKRGDRIAQLVIAPVVTANFTTIGELSDSHRGKAGFGSTGR